MTRSLSCVFTGKSTSAIPGGEFKEWIMNEARNLSLTGWVRSLHDDRLEVLVQGTDENIQKFRVHLLQGPPLSKVENMECKWIDYEKSFSAFEVRQ
ncbi:acylphosphatase [Desulfonatronum parangueonense]